ncbi:hypothetical protein OOK31_39085 [Streptomyces sp. NBC_00249]|uniref:hypothetical protein n=1 Tax=Streptomyces sp. NBC_00249 TaxID=2975690 RepID=UPI00224D8AED|nr:hypothetical protein [Streptomyces sp. NBC_00249]MCX5199814.1 hypothetical protein [Streptomyces sp. NBC_00249]
MPITWIVMGGAAARAGARTGLLTVCAQVLQAKDRVDFYAELANPVREQQRSSPP